MRNEPISDDGVYFLAKAMLRQQGKDGQEVSYNAGCLAYDLLVELDKMGYRLEKWRYDENLTHKLSPTPRLSR